MSITSDLAQEPGYFTRYKNFALSRSASGVLTLRFHTGGRPHTFDGTTTMTCHACWRTSRSTRTTGSWS